MNKNLLIVIGIVVLLGVGYVAFSSQQAPQPTTTTREQVTTAPASKEVSVTLSEENNSGEYGTATLMEEGGKVKVTLSLTGAPQGVTQPAHIHVGACPDVGAVKYPLTFPVNGTSQTLLDVAFDQLRAEMPLAVNVHKSAAEAKVYVSCGNLAL